MSTLLLGLMLVVFGLGWALAQDTSGDPKSKSSTRCCRKGITLLALTSILTANDGSPWEVRSDTVSLADHVGHKVSATGVVRDATAHNLKEAAKDAAADAHRTPLAFGRRSRAAGWLAMRNPVATALSISPSSTCSYIFTVTGSASLKLSVDFAGRTISLAPV